MTVIYGAMHSGKSTEMLRLVRRARFAGRQCIVFKPATDTRSGDAARSHDGLSEQAVSITNAADVLHLAPESVDLVAVDEAQFLEAGLCGVLDLLCRGGADVVVSGLDLDFRGEPFPTMSEIILKADHALKLTAVCTNVGCGGEASRSQRIINGDPVTSGDVVQIGGSESYEPRCRGCFVETTGILGEMV